MKVFDEKIMFENTELFIKVEKDELDDMIDDDEGSKKLPGLKPFNESD